MLIVHVGLTGPHTDGMSYQDNNLIKYHKKLGYDVVYIAPQIFYNSTGGIELDKRNIYINSDGVKIYRLSLVFNNFIVKKLRIYKNLFEILKKEEPDIIFVHGCQFLDIKYVAKYAKENPNVKVFVDNHADFNNSARNWLSKNILHKIIWRYCASLINPYTAKFWGVLPARVKFLEEVYGIEPNKIGFLPMGADDEFVEQGKQAAPIIRAKYRIEKDDFLIVTGGKIDSGKLQILLLMKAVKEIQNKQVKLIIFGSVVPEIKEEFKELLIEDKIFYAGWLNSIDSYGYFAAADLVVFPCGHSVFWEQVVAQGIPLLVKFWEGTTHVDIGGNCKFLYKDNEEELKQAILSIMEKDTYAQMFLKANCSKKKEFCYSKIAKNSMLCN